jgi:hypothetical protein
MAENKYLRRIYDARPGTVEPADTHVDVYMVCHAFGVKCQARGHAIKKLLLAGDRGAKSALQDLNEALDAVRGAIHIQEIEEGKWRS